MIGLAPLLLLTGPQAPVDVSLCPTAPPAWTYLKVPTLQWPIRAQGPAEAQAQGPVKARPLRWGSAVVEVTDRNPAEENHLSALALATLSQASAQSPFGGLHGRELGALMAAASNARPDFSKALVDATMEFWMPRPFQLDSSPYLVSAQPGAFATGPIGGSHDTSRRGPIGH